MNSNNIKPRSFNEWAQILREFCEADFEDPPGAENTPIELDDFLFEIGEMIRADLKYKEILR